MYNIGESYQNSLSDYETTYNLKERELAAIIVRIGKFLKKMIRYEDAENFMKRGLELTEKFFGPQSLRAAKVNYRMAQIYWNQGIWEPAEFYCSKALNIHEKLGGGDSLYIAKCLCGLGEINVLTRNPTKARPLFERSLAIREKRLGRCHVLVSRVLHGIGSIDATTGNYENAIKLHQEAIQIREKLLGEKHPDLSSYELLGFTYYLARNYLKADQSFRRSLEISELNHGKIHESVASSCLWLVLALRAQNKHYEAEIYQQRGDKIKEELQLLGVSVKERIFD